MTATQEHIRVRDIEHLKELCEDRSIDFCVALNGGVKSTKNISWDGRKFCVFNGISGTLDRYTPERLQECFIGEAIEAGAFYTDL